jgi:hypothetical protein
MSLGHRLYPAVLIGGLLGLTALLGAAEARRETRPIAGPVFNLDSTQFFFENPPATMSGEIVDAYLDMLADAGIRTLVSCVNAQKANYASRVWEPDWAGYDPAGPDDQPVLRYLPPASIAPTRARLESAKRLADLGIDLHDRLLARCRARGIGAWVSVRMNDVHDCFAEDSSLLSTFYKEQRAARQLRAPHRDVWWADRTLDWERPEVRAHYLKLVAEQLATRDLDGLELDWMRFVFHFRPGRELAGGKILTEWLRGVRALCDQAAVRLGRPVMLGVRVPSRPEVARRNGVDAVAWARAGLIDVVVPSPFWTTADFDIPTIEWKRLLEGTGVQLGAPVEIRYQSVPNGPAPLMTPELTVGALVPMLHQGADFAYLFNHFPLWLAKVDHPFGPGKAWTPASFARTVHALRSLELAAREARWHGVTFHDVRAPGEPADAALPAVDTRADFPWPPGLAFRVPTGPKPVGREVAVQITFAEGEAEAGRVRVYVNSVECASAAVSGATRTYAVPESALEDEAQVIELISPKDAKFTVVRLEVTVAAAR